MREGGDEERLSDEPPYERGKAPQFPPAIPQDIKAAIEARQPKDKAVLTEKSDLDGPDNSDDEMEDEENDESMSVASDNDPIRSLNLGT